YYQMQRTVGGLRTTVPIEHLAAGIQTWQHIQNEGRDPVDKVFFEVGTGRVPILPLAFWLMGARRTITVDINPYLKSELVREAVEYMALNARDVTLLFGARLQQHRFNELLQFHTGTFSLQRFLELSCIDYIWPGDAAQTGLPPHSVDFHT